MFVMVCGLNRRSGPMRSKVPWIITTVALVFALTGVSYGAAQRYIITQKNQIKPSVVRQLKGARGPAGRAGAPGPAGPAGPQGPAGANAAIKAAGVVTTVNGSVSVTAPYGIRNIAVGVYCLSGVPAGGILIGAPYNSSAIITQTPIGQCNTTDYEVHT